MSKEAIAKTNRELEEATQSTAPHAGLLIVDQMMPRKSGVELLTKLRKQPELRSIPVIFLTARARTEARIESLEAGTDDYLTKPFDTTELLANGSNCTGVYALKISGHLTTGQNSSDFKYS